MAKDQAAENRADQHHGSPARQTPLHALHVELGAKMVPFAGYEMPLHYAQGILNEHLHTRSAAGLFDVSHMGQAFVMAPDHAAAARALETLLPSDINELGLGRMRYSVLLKNDGGILDDLIVTRSANAADDGNLLIVINAARKEFDLAHIAAALPTGVTIRPAAARALIAIQGPAAAAALSRHCRQAKDLAFLSTASARFDDIDCQVSRSGYTGEDGFEISLADARAEEVARALLAEPEVEAIGLGARDSLRLEAGFCLYGHDLDETTSPVEADLAFVIPARRRQEANFPGATRILRELEQGPARRRVGIRPEGRAAAREGAEILDTEGREVGRVTSGGFGPSIKVPVAMGYVEAALAEPGTKLDLVVRGKPRAGEVVRLPFIKHRYKRRK